MNKNSDKFKFMNRAIELARQGMNNNLGGPFGAVIVKDSRIVGEGCNSVTSQHDPTAHAEMLAIRSACKHLSTFNLHDCVIYCSCEPCPMCLGAIYWSKIKRVYYAANRKNAANGGFDDEFIFQEFSLSPTKRKVKNIQLMAGSGKILFKEWLDKSDKIPY